MSQQNLSDTQYNVLCQQTQQLFGFTSVEEASFVVNHALSFRDYLEQLYAGAQEQSAEAGMDFSNTGGDFQTEGEFLPEDGGGLAFDENYGGDFQTEGEFLPEDGGGLAFDENSGGEFAGDDQMGFGNDVNFGLANEGDFAFDESPIVPAAPAPAPQQRRAAPVAQNTAPQARRPAAPAQVQRQPAAPAIRQAAASPAPATPQGNSESLYDKMTAQQIKEEIQARGLMERAKVTQGGLPAYKNLLKLFDQKVNSVAAKYSVQQLEAHVSQNNIPLSYGRGRSSDEKKKRILASLLISAGIIKL